MTAPVRAGTALRRSVSTWQTQRLAGGLRELDRGDAEGESEVVGG